MTSGVLGGLGAVGVSRALATAMASFVLPTGLTFAMVDAGLSAGHIFFTIALSVVIALAVNAGFGVRASCRLANLSLLGTANGALTSLRWRLRYGLLASHVAVSVVLLVGAALLARSVGQATGKNLGFKRQAIFVNVVPNIARYANPAASDIDFGKRLADFESFSSSVSELPGVVGVVEGDCPLYDPIGGSRGLTARALAIDGDVFELPYVVVDVGAGYFSRLGIPILAGRELAPEDAARGTSQAVVISAGLARRILPSGRAVGTRIVPSAGAQAITSAFEVVGVSGDAARHGVRSEPFYAVFRLVQHDPGRDMASPTFSLTVITATSPAIAKKAVSAIARAAFPGAYALRIDTVEERIAAQTVAERLGATLLACFGVVAVLICVVGVFSLAAHSSTVKLREAALRMALGGRPFTVLLELASSLWRASIVGAGSGVVLAALISPALRTYLYGLHSLDPVSYCTAVVIVLGSATVAIVTPMRRLVLADLSQLLRSEPGR